MSISTTHKSFSKALIQFFLALGLLLTPLHNHMAVASDPYNRDTAYIGIMSRLMFSTSNLDTRIATEMIFLDFMNNIGKKSQFIDIDSTKDAARKIQHHHLDAVISNALDYLEIDHLMNSNHRYSVLIGPSIMHKIILLTRRADEVTNLAQLRQKRLAYPIGLDLGLIFLDVSLMKQKLPSYKDFFSEKVAVKDVNTAIIDLFFNKVDAALVTDTSFSLTSELNPQISHELEPLINSQPIVPIMIGINKHVPSDFTDRVDEMVARLSEYPRTINLLSLFKATGLAKVTDKDLEYARRLKQEYKTLTNSAY
ncbi:MAG: PhnD/SsuA/transferrin family substrate-binding protein [Candidatus Thiodiazotropha sp.]